MIRYCRRDDEAVKAEMKEGKLDAVCSSQSSPTDDILRSMLNHGILDCLEEGIPDRRRKNASIPFKMILALSTAAKMKTNQSLTDITHAITDHRLLAELGYAMYDDEWKMKKNFMDESTIRNILEKYEYTEWFNYYNEVTQNHIMIKQELSANIHILDCTNIEVNPKNDNYEGSSFVYDDKKKMRVHGYKMATLRGVHDDTGIIEEVKWGAINIHDLELSRDMLYNTPMLKSGDTLICDRGFIDREVINDLKIRREVDIIIPLKRNMNAYIEAVAQAKMKDKWIKHPNKNRKTQKCAFIPNVGEWYESKELESDVPLNACVVWDTKATEPEHEYFVFVTTDTNMTAKIIIQTYELRPEIEESFRQIKDAWGIEDFKSTKQDYIAFHVVCTLFGYLFWELYKMLPEGKEYIGRSLPTIIKKFVSEAMMFIICFVKDLFGIFSIIGFADIYASCNNQVRDKLSNAMKQTET